MNSESHATLEIRPDFVIIGAMKCATSTIHDQLGRQPGISMSEPKEPNFFSDPENWSMGTLWYGSLFSSMPGTDLKGESSTHYTKLPTYSKCARRMHELLPDAKLIYVMRDPIERIVSQYIHEWSMHEIGDGCSIDEAIYKYPMLVDYSRYAMQLRPYLELFGFDAILPVFFERLMCEPRVQLERIARHIGYRGSVHWFEDDAKNVSSQRQRRSPALNKVLDVRLFQMVRRSLLPASVREKVRSRWTMSQRPELSAESRTYLRSQLDPDLKILGGYLGIELDCDRFKEQIGGAEELGWTGRWMGRSGGDHG